MTRFDWLCAALCLVIAVSAGTVFFVGMIRLALP